MADWSELPAELLHVISQYLHTSIDLLRFRSVCPTWRDAAPPPPPPAANFSFTTKTGELYYLSKRTLYLLQPSLPGQSSLIIKLGCANGNPDQMRLLPPIDDTDLIDCSMPWLLDFSNIRVRELGEEYMLQYINSRPRANSIGETCDLYKEKVAVLNNERGGFVILAIHRSRKLMVYKSGDEEWSFIDDEKWRVNDDIPWEYEDIILWRGRFYAVDYLGRIVLVNTEDFKVSFIASVDILFHTCDLKEVRKVFVGCDTELLLVDMVTDYMKEYIPKMKVYRLDGEKFTLITDLGDKIVFLDRNCGCLASPVQNKCSGVYYNTLLYDLENGLGESIHSCSFPLVMASGEAFCVG